MTLSNSEISKSLSLLAELLEIDDANPFRIRAYRNAARVIDNLPTQATQILEEGGDLTEYPGIGKDLAAKIEELNRSGTLPLLEELKQKLGHTVSELLRIPGLGPKKVRILRDELGIDSIAKLQAALASGNVKALPGFGEVSERKIREGLTQIEASGERVLLAEAEEEVTPLLNYLTAVSGVREIDVAGSFRRRKETVGDIDIVVGAKKSCPVLDRLIAYQAVAQVVAHGETRATVILRSGLQVDCRLVPEASFGAALHYFTGSKEHNIAIRTIGVKRGVKVNEYGVYRGRRRIAGRTESDLYAFFGLPYIPPELRENQGEIDAAEQGALPDLVRVEDLKGDLHMHSTYSDGKNSIREMAEAAKAMGYEYIAITDHSKQSRIANGLDERRLRAQMEEIDELNEELQGITLLKGSEVDILDNGKLDFPDSVLRDLDIVVCSIHSRFELSKEQQTTRLLRAMQNRHVSIIAHPTGRLLNKRAGYEIDIERVALAAKECGCALEINSQPKRLDLSDTHARLVNELGVRLSIDSDAHGVAGLGNIRYGVGQARRAWVEARNVLNTLGLPDLLDTIRR